MLARYELWLRVCLSVSVTIRCSVETCGLIELISGMAASFNVSCTLLYGNSGISENNGTSGTLSNSGPKNFATARRSSQCAVSLARQSWEFSAVNGTVVGPLSWQHLRRSTDSLCCAVVGQLLLVSTAWWSGCSASCKDHAECSINGTGWMYRQSLHYQSHWLTAARSRWLGGRRFVVLLE